MHYGYTRRGQQYFVASSGAEPVEHLPAGNFVIRQTPFKEFYFERVDGFTSPDRLYGDVQKTTDRIWNTYLARDTSTGVLLSGERGSGKTMQARMLSLRAAEHGHPTILVDEPWCGSDFNQLIQSIHQRAVILFDEYEKVYVKEQQEELLTLLDGTFPTCKLFVLTCNDRYRVDSHMCNRPGRIFYSLEYEGLDADFIATYCQENLDDKSQIKVICDISALFAKFNFDMLKALVEEMNRYKEPALESLRYLNAKPEPESNELYDVELEVRGKTVQPNSIHPTPIHENPMRMAMIRLYYSLTKPKGTNGDTEHDDLLDDDNVQVFTAQHLVRLDGAEGLYQFDNGAAVATLRKQKPVRFSLDMAYSRFR